MTGVFGLTGNVILVKIDMRLPVNLKYQYWVLKQTLCRRANIGLEETRLAGIGVEDARLVDTGVEDARLVDTGIEDTGLENIEA